VRERTAELQRANEYLMAEGLERERIEGILLETRAELTRVMRLDPRRVGPRATTGCDMEPLCLSGISDRLTSVKKKRPV